MARAAELAGGDDDVVLDDVVRDLIFEILGQRTDEELGGPGEVGVGRGLHVVEEHVVEDPAARRAERDDPGAPVLEGDVAVDVVVGGPVVELDAVSVGSGETFRAEELVGAIGDVVADDVVVAGVFLRAGGEDVDPARPNLTEAVVGDLVVFDHVIAALELDPVRRVVEHRIAGDDRLLPRAGVHQLHPHPHDAVVVDEVVQDDVARPAPLRSIRQCRCRRCRNSRR